jgi:hypothetical protein
VTVKQVRLLPGVGLVVINCYPNYDLMIQCTSVVVN